MINTRVNKIQNMKFSAYLILVGEGQNVDFSEFIILPNSLKSLIEYIYNPRKKILCINLTKGCILTPLDEEIERINNLINEKFQQQFGQQKIYYSAYRC